MSTDHSPEERTGSAHRRDYSPEEIARRGDAIYERTIRTQVEAEHQGEVVAINIDTGAFAVGENALTAIRRLRARQPGAEVWCVRVGSRALHRIGVTTSLGAE